MRNLKSLVEILESEVYSDTSAYTSRQENFDDPIEYYSNDDDDGYPD